MTTSELLTFYGSRKSLFSRQLRNVTDRINRVSNGRLTLAVLFIVALYFGFTITTVLYFLPLLFLIFIVLVKNHGRLFDRKTHLESLVRINEQEMKLLQGDRSVLDSGSEFIDARHHYAHDLDIFGQGSVYQYLNRCNTLSGRKNFAQHLKSPLQLKADIELRQTAIRELAKMTEFRQQFQAAGMEVEEGAEDQNQLVRWTKQSAFVYRKAWYRYILILVPALTIALITASFFSTVFRPFAILMAALQWGFIGLHMKRINDFHEFISRKKNILKKYSRLLHFLQTQSFFSPLMIRLSGDARNADEKVGQLASLVSAFDARLNSMTRLVVNSVLLYDLQCVYRLERWKEENAIHFERWLQAVSDAEVLCSLGTFAFNNPSYTYPVIGNTLSLTATSMGHPLIGQAECVVNDFRLGGDHQVLIVTGANMAGKSTFLRTIGVNIVLALNGAPVFATAFSCPLVHLRTGMRTADSLQDHQSYFYAELDRLQGIMDDLRKEIPLLILLDEILKGTNSTDKQAGSIALVKQLLPHPCLAVIATHDLALGELESEFPGHIRNYCFEANIENDQLSFDYRLKPGLARKLNATFLMKKMGIIPD